MYYNQLLDGWIIEFRKIQDEQLQYHKTPTYKTKRELNTRLKELYEDPSVLRAEVFKIKYFDKTEG